MSIDAELQGAEELRAQPLTMHRLSVVCALRAWKKRECRGASVSDLFEYELDRGMSPKDIRLSLQQLQQMGLAFKYHDAAVGYDCWHPYARPAATTQGEAP